ncbi:MAG: FtsL-like putative cell division protein [Bacteroidota bacterium]
MAKQQRNINLYDWVPYLGLVCLLTLFYIATVHHAEKKIRRINQKHREIETLRREYISIKQKSQYNGTLYQVAKEIEGVDMESEIHVPKKIERDDV